MDGLIFRLVEQVDLTVYRIRQPFFQFNGVIPHLAQRVSFGLFFAEYLCVLLVFAWYSYVLGVLVCGYSEVRGRGCFYVGCMSKLYVPRFHFTNNWVLSRDSGIY